MENTCKQDFELTLAGQINRMETLVGEVKQLVESLTAENKMLKERLAQTREAMAQAMIETKISFAEIILEEQKMQKENSKLLHDCQEAINECLKANDNEGAVQIYHRFAPEFENLGLSGLTLDPEIDNNNN